MKSLRTAFVLVPLLFASSAMAMASSEAVKLCARTVREKGFAGTAYQVEVKKCVEEKENEDKPVPNVKMITLSKAKADQRIVAAQKLVRDTLNDPASAQFKKLQYIAETGAVCGMFNGKNAMGGYGPFLFFGVDYTNQLHVLEDPSKPVIGTDAERLDFLQKNQREGQILGALCPSM